MQTNICSIYWSVEQPVTCNLQTANCIFNQPQIKRYRMGTKCASIYMGKIRRKVHIFKRQITVISRNYQIQNAFFFKRNSFSRYIGLNNRLITFINIQRVRLLDQKHTLEMSTTFRTYLFQRKRL